MSFQKKHNEVYQNFITNEFNNMNDDADKELLKSISQFPKQPPKQRIFDRIFDNALIQEFRELCYINDIDLNGQQQILQKMQLMQQQVSSKTSETQQSMQLQGLNDVSYMEDILQQQAIARQQVERIPSDVVLKQRQKETREPILMQNLVKTVGYQSVNNRPGNQQKGQEIIIKDQMKTLQDQQYLTPLGAQMIIGQIPTKNLQVEQKNDIIEEVQDRYNYQNTVDQQMEVGQSLPMKEYEEPLFQSQEVDHTKAINELLLLLLDNIPPDLLVQIKNIDQFLIFLQNSSIIQSHDISQIAAFIKGNDFNDFDPSEFDFFQKIKMNWNNDVVIKRNQLDIEIGQLSTKRNITVEEAVESLQQFNLDFKLQTQFVDYTANNAGEFGKTFLDRLDTIADELYRRREIVVEKVKSDMRRQFEFENIAKQKATVAEKFAINMKVSDNKKRIVELEAHLEDFQQSAELFMDPSFLIDFLNEKHKNEFFKDETNQVVEQSALLTPFMYNNDQLRYIEQKSFDEELQDQGILVIPIDIVEPQPNLEFNLFIDQEIDVGHNTLSEILAKSYAKLQTPLVEQTEVFSWIASNPGNNEIGEYYRVLSDQFSQFQSKYNELQKRFQESHGDPKQLSVVKLDTIKFKDDINLLNGQIKQGKSLYACTISFGELRGDEYLKQVNTFVCSVEE